MGVIPAPLLAAGAFTDVLGGIERVSLGIEVLATAIIVLGILFAAARFGLESMARPPRLDAYDRFKVLLGRALLLGLEILVAADVVRTVALEPSLQSVTVLGVLVLIRTFLSWSLVVEIEGRWPWQGRGEAARAEGQARNGGARM